MDTRADRYAEFYIKDFAATQPQASWEVAAPKRTRQVRKPRLTRSQHATALMVIVGTALFTPMIASATQVLGWMGF
jgi:hypothetical protein